MTSSRVVMVALVAGIHVFKPSKIKGVDGLDNLTMT
jgi:hypothetical protein